MDAKTHLFLSAEGSAPTLTALERSLAGAGISLTREDSLMLAARRTESLASLERVEFGTPAIVAIAKAVGDSPHLTQKNAAASLALLQDAFYSLRDELPIDVPDDEIVEALQGCLDELGDAAEVAAIPTDELMAYSKEYVQALEAEHEDGYRIVDDEGRVYAFDSNEWAYDETSPGWEGERWADDWDA